MENNNVIIVNFHLFTKNQDVLVYKNGQVQAHKVPLDMIVNFVYNYCVKFDIHQVDLYGGSAFTKKYQYNIREKIKENYDKNQIEVNIRTRR